jgi:hypothetical protein
MLAPLHRHAPEAYSAWLAANAAAERELDPDLYGLAQERVHSTLGAPGTPVEPSTPLERAAVELIEQFVTYVPEVTERHLAPVRDELGDDALETFVYGLYVLDLSERMRLALGRIFETSEPGPDEQPADLPLRDAVDEAHAAAMRLSAVDPISTEVVRLRCAHYHDCGT